MVEEYTSSRSFLERFVRGKYIPSLAAVCRNNSLTCLNHTGAGRVEPFVSSEDTEFDAVERGWLQYSVARPGSA